MFLGCPRWHLHPTSSCLFENKVSTLCLGQDQKGLYTCLSFSLKEQLQAADSLAFLFQVLKRSSENIR